MPPGRVACRRTVSWTFVYLMVGLKIPIAALLYLVWWAIHQTPDTAEPGDGRRRHPRHPPPPLPRRPRPRGAHGLPIPVEPKRMRVVAARSLATARARREHAGR